MSDSLPALQHCFQSYVLTGDQQMLTQVCAPAKSSAATRLSVYAEAYHLRLRDALATDFPALHTLAGDALFEQLGRAYLAAHPSQHFSIRYFGERLSAFLAFNSPYREMPVLSEMATLEWALGLAFDAADMPSLDVATLSALPSSAWPTLRLRFHPSVQRRDFHWNVPALWSAIDAHSAPQAPEISPELTPWLIWRQELQNYFRSLNALEAQSLDRMREGADFATLCEALCEQIHLDEVGLTAARFLKNWVAAGLVSEIY
ncbi:MAG: HvfC/BufC N-terminal domain-containing protein [Gammaproteobacteria bacterium]